MGNIAKFFKSVPGILTAVGIALAGIVGIVSQSTSMVEQCRKFVAAVHPPPPELVKVPKAANLNVLPYQLRNLVGRPDLPYLYWYDIEVENDSKVSVHLKVNYDVTTKYGDVIQCNSPESMVGPKKSIPWHPPTFPRFGQRHVKPGDTLLITWHLIDNIDNTFNPGRTDTTLLLPDNTVDWDLKGPNGEAVPVDFVLASLTAWTVPPIESLAKIVEQLQNGIGRAAVRSSVDRWFASCYRRFFQNPSRNPDFVQVSSAKVTFPGTGRQTIRSFSDILDEHTADPLEAALFLGALSRATYGKRLRLALFAVSESQDQPAAKTILFSWSTDSVSWHAVNLAQANGKGFADNEELASKQVTKLLADHPEIIPALKDPGVFIEKGQQAVALDFVYADKKYQFTASQ